MRPKPLRHGKGKEFPCWSVPGRFSLAIYGAGVDIASDVRVIPGCPATRDVCTQVNSPFLIPIA